MQGAACRTRVEYDPHTTDKRAGVRYFDHGWGGVHERVTVLVGGVHGKD